MFRHIRWRIAVPFILLILSTMIVSWFYLANYLQESFLSDLETNLSDQAGLISDFVSQSLLDQSSPEVIDALAKSWAEVTGVRVTLIDATGVVVGESQKDRTTMDNHADRPEIVQASLTGQGQATRYSDTAGYRMMYVARAVHAGDKLLGFARVAVPLRQVDSRLAQLQRNLLLALSITILLALLLALWISARISHPLVDLAEAARQVAGGNLETHLIPATQDEVGHLTEAFNHMARQLSNQIQALEAERSRIAGVLGVMTDGVIIVDQEGRVSLINAAARAIFELRDREVEKHSIAEVLRHHQIIELWEDCRQTGIQGVTSMEIPSHHLFLQVFATPLGKALPGSILLLVQNLSRIRQLETVRQDFISNISHELRTPLASLKALSETLQESALEDPPAARHFLRLMETELDALAQLVEELLELSRIESGRVPLKLAPTSPRLLIDQAVARLRIQAERKALEVLINCDPEIPPVSADSNRLEQVVVNLIHNAIKFTEQGGQIVIQASVDADRQVVRFSVKDTGVGIAENDLKRIFERFYKTDRARTSSGTGLGLAIARHLVEAHGGRIWAENIEGQGSTFFFTIPLHSPAGDSSS